MAYDFLETPVEYCKGVGPQRADMLKKELEIFTFGDLLVFYPFRYVDRSRFYKVADIREDLPYCPAVYHHAKGCIRPGKRSMLEHRPGKIQPDSLTVDGRLEAHSAVYP